jgi:ribose 5-phosphate isomerase A
VTDRSDELKQAAGRHAAGLVDDGMRVGLGTGSTVHWTIVALGERNADIVCVATSERTKDLATSLGLSVVAPDAVDGLDVAIDGADEVDPALNLTKGGGGAHTREKIVAHMAARFVVVVDQSKLVDRLGPFGTPVEILPFAAKASMRWIGDLGASEVTLRDERSDSGNLLADARFGEIEDPEQLAARLSAVPGLVDHGIFPAAVVERVVVARADGVEVLTRRPRS